MNEKEKNKKLWRLILLLLLVTSIATATAIWAWFFRGPDAVLAPDYAPTETESYAEAIPNDADEKNEAEQGGGSVSLTYSNEVIIDLSDQTATLLFANPGRSSHDMLIQIVVQDQVLVQSGLLKAGNQVKNLAVSPETAGRLKTGGYDGLFMIYYYDQSSGERAVVNTEIPIHITVRD